MPSDTGYMDVDALMDAVGDITQVHIPEHERAISAASRQIDLWTGRYFYQDDTATARLFRAFDRTKVCVGDFTDPGSVIVQTDDDFDGVFETTWDDEDWQAEPFVLFNDWPPATITTTTRTREFPLAGRRPPIKVTARWGWEAIPGPIEQACESLATLYYRSKDSSSGGMIGIDTNVERLSTDPIAVAMALCRDYAVYGGTLYVPPMPVEHELVLPKGRRR